MLRFDDEAFQALAHQVAFCLGNIRHPRCSIAEAGRFYEEAAEALRGHAILRLLLDADGDGFSNDLVMSGQARRAYLRRCAGAGHDDYFLALSRSGSILDGLAGDDPELAAEIFALSPATFRPGDEYEDDFCWGRFLGLFLSGAPAAALDAPLDRLAELSDGAGARLAVARALRTADAARFEQAFDDLLRERRDENAADAALADEDLCAALGSRVFVEGVAVLKLARRAGLPIAIEYPMCPALALLPRTPARPADEFAPP